jgi:hypothetical protein
MVSTAKVRTPYKKMRPSECRGFSFRHAADEPDAGDVKELAFTA